MASDRLSDLKEFYRILDQLSGKLGGARLLSSCSGRQRWPQRGIYFFMEDGEARSDSGMGPRITRVGTHALSAGAQSTLWRRIAQHRGVTKTLAGNHRGSVFRLLVGSAIIVRDKHAAPHWSIGSNASSEIRAGEATIEREVTRILGSTQLLWLEVEDEPGPKSMRGYVERNSIALLSNVNKAEPLDPPSQTWLGRSCPVEKVRASGLWNQNHVGEEYDPAFLAMLRTLVLASGVAG